MTSSSSAIDDPITYAVIGCAMTVHNTLGCGFQEVIYQRALAIELNKARLEFAREVEQAIYYGGQEIGTRRADFIVAGNIVVELKALSNLENLHIVQAKNYIVAYGFEKGLLINFGAERLQYKRIYRR
jgi:GxxExxY protein